MDEREVSTAEGVDLAKSLKIPFFEASAKTPTNNFEQFHGGNNFWEFIGIY